MEMEEKKINTYEISFLVNSAEDKEAVLKHLQNAKAEIVMESPVSEISLAYPVLKKNSANFGYIHFKLDAHSAAGLNDVLRLDKKIMRFLILTPPPEKTLRPRADSPIRTAKKKTENDLSNEALGEKLAALQGNA